ncbi:hypothetical protein MKEN_00313900 [Mycena kentingensis (nom. inval.)]|nr:hypothetical protein MKEN_00313900 [Mycena kentingensis (nom. inval.)]
MYVPVHALALLGRSQSAPANTPAHTASTPQSAAHLLPIRASPASATQPPNSLPIPPHLRNNPMFPHPHVRVPIATDPGLSKGPIPELATLSIAPNPPSSFDSLRVSSLTPSTNPSTRASDIAVAAISRAFPQPGKARRPKAGNAHKPNSLRPFVPASMRILAWQTPFGEERLGSTDYLPAADMARVRAEIMNSLAENSRSAYGAGPLRFTQYCVRNDIPESARMPAEPFLLACFIADSIGQHGLKSALNWLNGLAFWHAMNFAPWHGKDPSFRRPPGPVSVDHLRCIRANLDISSPEGAATWALATSAFWGCRRLGELTLRCKSKFDPVHDVSRSASLSRTVAGGRKVISIHLPWTKTTGSRGGTLILTATGDDLCPVAALENHLRVNHSPNEHTPLFAFRTSSGWSPIVKFNFLAFVSGIFKTAKLDQVFGHSFRIGGSVHLLCSGVEPEIVMKIGGWTSTCFLIYWRKLETVIPVALSRAWDKERAAFMRRNDLEDEADAEINFTSLRN